MNNYNSDQSVLATAGAEGANDATLNHESYGGPVSFAEYFLFPDAKRVLLGFEDKLREVGFGFDNQGYLELCFTGEESSALDQAGKLSNILRELAEWLDVKVDAYRVGELRFPRRIKPFFNPMGGFEGFGQILENCGNEFLVGYVERWKDTWLVEYHDYWDTVVLRGSSISINNDDDFPDEVKKLFVDLHVHAAKQGYTQPE